MKSTDAPSLITTPFAQNGTRNDIPTSDPGFSGDDAGRAAFTTGFPDITMRPITAGGKPPFGADFNGVLYALSNAARFYGAGGHYRFNGSFAAAIGGYPIGATVQASDGMGHWLNVVEANGMDPESALSTGWIPLSDHNGTATVNIGGNTALTALQAAKANIRFTGSQPGNTTITFPAWTKRYSIINDCTGDQSLICTTGNGESISIKNGAKYEIGCDGKNLTVTTVNASQVFADPNKSVSSLDAPTVQQIIDALGSASKHNHEDYDLRDSAANVQRNLDIESAARKDAIDKLGSASRHNAEDFDSAGAASSVKAAIDNEITSLINRLKSAAYTESTAYDAAGSASAVQNIIENEINYLKSILKSAAYTDSSAYDAAGTSFNLESRLNNGKTVNLYGLKDLPLSLKYGEFVVSIRRSVERYVDMNGRGPGVFLSAGFMTGLNRAPGEALYGFYYRKISVQMSNGDWREQAEDQQ